MNKLPSNPSILLSIVNMKLRDFYSSLDLLCEDLDENRDEIVSILSLEGYNYDSNLNQFIYKRL